MFTFWRTFHALLAHSGNMVFSLVEAIRPVDYTLQVIQGTHCHNIPLVKSRSVSDMTNKNILNVHEEGNKMGVDSSVSENQHSINQLDHERKIFL